MLTNFARIIIAVITLAVVAGLLFARTYYQPVIEPVEIPERPQAPNASEPTAPASSTNTELEMGGVTSSSTATSSPSATTTALLDRVVITAPVEEVAVSSSVELTGQAPGNWFFEASAPVVVVDWDGRIIGESYVTADGEWMTEELVPFAGTISYELASTTYSASGTIIFQRANPSGLPANDAAVEVLVELVPNV